jgi:hypothetical protein
MRNQYVIRGNIAVIFVDAPPNGGYGYLEVKIDVADLERVKVWPGSWYGFVKKSNGLLYIRAAKTVNLAEGFTQKQPLLHRFIAAPGKGENTCFKDGDSLNCTRANLVNLRIGEVYTPPEPITDPTVLPVVKGVHWRPEKQRFEVRCFHKGKGYYLGVYPAEAWQEANKVAAEFRELGPEEFIKNYKKGGTTNGN